MRQVADFHIHTKYSRACSRELELEKIDRACRTKGVDIIGTGDFTHPAWFSDISKELEESRDAPGLYFHKRSKDDKIKFILTTELALVYKKLDRARRIHVVVHAPSVDAVSELIGELEKGDYNLKSDGRPILGMSAERLCEMCFSIDDRFMIYPAHIWTPWYAVFGSKSGFDKLEDCFGEYTDRIYAYETGLSSDPEMNWRLSALDNLSLLSNSDAHSLPNIAREANVFEFDELSYNEIYDAIMKKDMNRIKYTIEFYPDEGMYHWDGHRECGVRFSPKETKKHKGICPKCRKPLVIGVEYRVDELADREIGYKPDNAYGYKKLVELDKIIAESEGIKSRNSKKVQGIYRRMISEMGTELDILEFIEPERIEEVVGKRLADGIMRMREGKLVIEPGFDGQYGTVKIFSKDGEFRSKQQSLLL